jgi:hypothetical protein
MSTAKAVVACLFGLAVVSSTWAGGSPCAPAAADPEQAGICVYNVGKKNGFGALKVVVNGEVQGKLARKQPWILVSVKPGAHVVGIDIGDYPQARRKVETVAGQVTYLRYQYSFDSQAGFFDRTSQWQTQLQEVSASDALGDLDQFAGSRTSKPKKT